MSTDLDALMAEFWVAFEADHLGAAEDKANAVVALDRLHGVGYASRAMVKRRRAQLLPAYADLLVAIALGARTGADTGTLPQERDELRAELLRAPGASGPADDAVARAILGPLEDLFGRARDVVVSVIGELVGVPTGWRANFTSCLASLTTRTNRTSRRYRRSVRPAGKFRTGWRRTTTLAGA